MTITITKKHLLTKEKITENDIDHIESNIGVCHGAWDTVNQKEIILEIYNYFVLKNEAVDLINKMRKIACETGPLHCYWDIIFDMECLLKGRATILRYNLEQYVDYAKKTLAKDGHWD